MEMSSVVMVFATAMVAQL